ncbi:dTDP-glucose 4,6-dehydratase [Terrisporobacter mayombei]|uniref:dTDP-glucose 4,6-dehydratase n=1 Tax=Terrisporobacter mayombei TaxID=1541 RepID=A0ABY9Q8K8_9FIRM|nr:dTDP-glucose 4,6-dehydratase [Terrisporobacter mayombei]MCC3869504.1 dTDP-glucose 4,6-dehydratase [Terrisporobacter mayombei]WMT83559.1 dTDP-glucose 4,6-dehydratase [Terrisporobacter mayombei]
MKKILITGGAGFIGSNFIRYMINKYDDYNIVNLDLLTYAGNLNNLKELEGKKNYEFIRGDISDREFILKLFEKEKFEMVVNFAAESHVDNSISYPSIFMQTNIVGTQVLLEACRIYGIERYHQVSTDEVYGQLPLDKKELLFTENTSLNPSSPYSASKASADFIVNSYNKTYNMHTTISRCSNNYGPYQNCEKLIPLSITKVLNNELLPIYGSGANIRDWLHVNDHCEAIDLILHKGRIGEVYNIGGNNEKTNLEVAKCILERLGKSEELITYVKDRAGHDLRYAIDSSKLKNELGWEPRYIFEDGIIETIEWYLKNKMWWNPTK